MFKFIQTSVVFLVMVSVLFSVQVMADESELVFDDDYLVELSSQEKAVIFALSDIEFLLYNQLDKLNYREIATITGFAMEIENMIGVDSLNVNIETINDLNKYLAVLSNRHRVTFPARAPCFQGMCFK